jgi:hypothetical protein
MATWWIVIDEKTAPFSYNVVESNSEPSPLASDGGPFYTQAAAESEAATLNGNAKKGVAGSLKSGAAAAASDVLGKFNIGSWFVRIGEILAGLILVGIGLNAMLKGKPMSVVTGTAGAVGKVAMF